MTTTTSKEINDGVESQSSDELDLIVFTMAGELYAMNIKELKEVVRIPDITRVPNAADCVIGVMNLRGMITTILDLNIRFGKGQSWRTSQSRILVIADGTELIGVLVDSVEEIIHVGEDSIYPAEDLDTSIDASYICGVVQPMDEQGVSNAGKLIILHELQSILKDQLSATGEEYA